MFHLAPTPQSRLIMNIKLYNFDLNKCCIINKATKYIKKCNIIFAGVSLAYFFHIHQKKYLLVLLEMIMISLALDNHFRIKCRNKLRFLMRSKTFLSIKIYFFIFYISKQKVLIIRKSLSPA